MVTQLMRLTAPAVAGVAVSLVFASPPAMAQDDGPVVVQAPRQADRGDYQLRMERVAYHDLNLATHEGQQIFQRRVGRAVRHVCITHATRTHGLSQSDHYRCTVGAWRMAWPQMNTAITRAQQFAANYRR